MPSCVQAVGRKRIARLTRAAGIVGVSHRRSVITTRRDRDARPAPDLVDRNFTADRPNQLWVADITYIPTAAGFLYLAVVLDAFSRRIVGWAMETHLRTELVLAALEMAIGQRRPGNVIHHSDQGTQYTSLAFGGRCREAGVLPSMGSVGDAYDNAMCESFFATLECELLARRRFTLFLKLSSRNLSSLSTLLFLSAPRRRSSQYSALGRPGLESTFGGAMVDRRRQLSRSCLAGDQPVTSTAVTARSALRAGGTSADRGFRAGRHGGGAAAQYRDGSA